MQLGMIGLGRMGGNMVRRLLRAGHDIGAFDVHAPAVHAITQEGAVGTTVLADFVKQLSPPRHVWLMIPAGLVDGMVQQLIPLLSKNDVVIDGGNSHYHDDVRRAKELQGHGMHYVDVGVSGGVWGLERGYCMMIGGESKIVKQLEPVFQALAPGFQANTRTEGRQGEPSPAEQGFLHCGPAGAGHFVKMVHNGIEYGLMAAYAEGFNVLAHADIGKHARTADAETTPLKSPEHFQYDFNLADVAELWRRGSVIGSWLLDLTARALHKSPELEDFAGKVADSGEGRWTVATAIEAAVPTPVLSAALFDRFASRGEADFANKLLSAMRLEFGGHVESK